MEGELELRGVNKNFGGVKALSHLSFAVRKGGVTGIVGPNGSGKSTLVNLLTGMYSCDGGAVFFRGERVDFLPPWDLSGLGFARTFQEVRLWNQMSVLDNILVVLTERGFVSSLFEKHRADHLARAYALLRRVGLFEKKDSAVIFLSYGQRKLLEIARVLAMPADYFFFDEPFAGLFPSMVATVSEIILELKEEGRAVVLIEHNMKLIKELCDHLVVLDGGELLAEGRPVDVLRQKSVIEAYLGT